MGYFALFKNEGVPFMEGRDKGEKSEILDKPLHIADFGFINGNDGKFAVMLFAEIPDKFYFGNSIVTEMLEAVERDNQRQALKEVQITFKERKAKESGRTYIAFDIDEDATPF